MNNIENIENIESITTKIANIEKPLSNYQYAKSVNGDVKYDGSIEGFRKAFEGLERDVEHYKSQNPNGIVKFNIVGSRNIDINNPEKAAFEYIITIFSANE